MSERTRQDDPTLLHRLGRLRGVLRRRLLAYGLCAVGAGGVCGLLAIITLDSLLWFPPVVRLVVSLSFALGFALASLHWVGRPLRARLSSAELAGELETHFRHLNDRLSSTVDFLQRRGVGSPAMQEQVIANTEAVVKKLPMTASLTLRPLAFAVALLVISVGLAAYISAIAPSWPQIGVSRYLAPFSGLQWPRRVGIFSLTRDQKVAYGESAVVRMQVVRGASQTLRGVVRVKSESGDVTTLAMHRRGDNVYACKIDHLTETVVCWFEAGDDTTIDQPRTLTVVRRPVVVSAVGRLHPPPYAPTQPVKEVDLSGGVVRAVRGSRLDLDIRSNKPVKQLAGAALAELAVDDTPVAALHFTDDDPTRLHASLPVSEDLAFAVRLTDEDGFASASGATYRIDAVPDQAPSVTIAEPRSVMEVTPSAVVNLAIEAVDDLGIREMSIVAQRAGEDAQFSIPLTGSLVTTSDASDRVVGSVEYRWSIAQHLVKPGDTILYRARVIDNFPGPGREGQAALSAPMRLSVVSRESFEQRQGEEFALLEGRIRQTLVDQELLIDETTRLAVTLEGAGEQAGGDALTAAALAQGRLAKALESLGRRTQRLIRRMEDNAVGDDQARWQAQQVSSSLTETASGPMAEATRALDGARDAADDERVAQIADGTVHQREAAEALRRVIHTMGQWGDFQEVVAKTRNLLDRQQAVRGATVRQQDKTLGRSVEALDERSQTAVRQNARLQTMLAEETAQLLARMRQVMTRSAEKDPVTSAALDDAVRAAVAARIVQDMRAAAGAIAANRTAAAQIGQRTAEAGLADMLAALQERRKRQLEQLAKTLERAEQIVAHLLNEQRDLRTATEEGLRLLAGGEVFSDLGRRQHVLKGNARRLAADWRGQDDLSNAAGKIKQCGAVMEEAAISLTEGDGSAAVDPQQQAIALLEQILEELTRMAAEARHQADRQQLAVTRAKLESLRSRQQEINGGTAEVLAGKQRRGRLGRLEARKASALGRRQDELLAETAALRREMGRAVVYDFVLGRIVRWMGESAEALAARMIDEALTDTQERIVAEFDMLVAALADIYNLPPPDDFERGGTGGGAGEGGQASAAVPTLAELLVLRAMQAALNARTVQAGENYRADQATEEELQAIRRLGDEQEQIEDLAREVINKANERGP